MLKKNFYVVNDGEIDKGFNNRKDADCYAYQLADEIAIEEMMESTGLERDEIPDDEIPDKVLSAWRERAGVEVRTKEEIEKFMTKEEIEEFNED